jgi:competence protein ComEC
MQTDARRVQSLRLGALVILLLIDIVAWSACLTSRPGYLTVAFLAIGQGDSIFVESAAGTQLLIDGGPDRAVVRELGSRIPVYDRSIDLVLATHPDADHIGGLPDVLGTFDVGAIVENGGSSETATFRAWQASGAAEPGARIVRATRGTVIMLDEETRLTVLFPDRDVTTAESNDGSIVARLDYGDISFLFTGDAPERIERYLTYLEPTLLDSDVLKVGHHGSKTSTSEGFVAAVTPTYAVISAGRDNRYGHPHKDVLDTLVKAGTEILRTDELGTVVFESDGTRLWRR